jgi:hypothetical protein
MRLRDFHVALIIFSGVEYYLRHLNGKGEYCGKISFVILG